MINYINIKDIPKKVRKGQTIIKRKLYEIASVLDEETIIKSIKKRKIQEKKRFRQVEKDLENDFKNYRGE